MQPAARFLAAALLALLLVCSTVATAPAGDRATGTSAGARAPRTRTARRRVSSQGTADARGSKTAGAGAGAGARTTTKGGDAGFMSGKIRTFTRTTTTTTVSHEYSSSSGMKINEANILLPYTQTNRTAQFVLSTSGSSCFQWMSSNTEYATVHALPEDEECHHAGVPADVHDVHAQVSRRAAEAAAAIKSGLPGRPVSVGISDSVCSSQAVVTATSRFNLRKSAVIKARANDDYYLRCDVFVAPIARLDISTVIERIGVGTTYTVSVTAYDEHDNTFSSLEGLRFQWSTSPHTDILTIAKLSKSQKRVSHLRESAERDAWSDAVVLHGMQTGRVNITVKLTEPGYDLEPAIKEIKVVERPDIIPSDVVYICPAERIQYMLTRVVDFRDVPISMPDPHFRWHTRHQDVAVVDEAMGLLTGVNKGRTEVVVFDRRLEEDMTQSTVYVVEPAYLDITLVPVTDVDDDWLCPGFDPALGLEQRASSAGNWHVVQGREYMMTVELVDESFNRMYIGENVRFEVSLDEEATGAVLVLADESENLGPLPKADGTPGDAVPGRVYGTSFRVVAEQLGDVVISAQLREVADSVTGHVWHPRGGPLKTVETAVVSNPVELVAPPSPIILPDVLFGARHNVTLKAEGGTGKYSYHKGQAAGADVFQVTPAGVVISGQQGDDVVVVRDLANPINCDTGNVVVVPAAELAFLPSEVEVEVGGRLRLFATARPNRPDLPRRYVNCFGLASAVTWRVHDHPLLSLAPARPTPSVADWEEWDAQYDDESVCASELFVGLRPGFTTVQIAYGDLTAVVRVSVYEPLRVVFPPPMPGCRHAEALVALGAAAPIVLHGGPAAWALGTRVVGGRSDVDDRVDVPNADSVRLQRSHGRAYTRQYAYVATCLEHGTQNITFSVANRASKEYIPMPVVSQVTVEFTCAPPQHGWLRLASNASLPDAAGSAAWPAAGGGAVHNASLGARPVPSAAIAGRPGCDASCAGGRHLFDVSMPSFDEATLHLRGPESYVVRTNQTVPVLLDLFDGSSPPRRFLNFSTVQVAWSLSLSNEFMEAELLPPVAGSGDLPTAAAVIASLTTADDEDEDVEGTVCAAVVLAEWPGSQSRLVKLGTKTGFVKVTATAESFVERMLRAARLAKDILDSALAGTYFRAVRHTIRLELVDQVRLLPPYAVLFNHPQNVLRLNAIGGSQRFEYTINDTLADMAVDRSNEFVDLTPRAPGSVQVTVYDVGLETSRSASSCVLISDAHRVSLRVRDQIELGSTVPLFVDVIDTGGNYFPASQYKFMDLNFSLDHCQLRVANKVRLVEGEPGPEDDRTEPVFADTSSAAGGRPFDLTGLALGSARIIASVRHSGATIEVNAATGAASGTTTLSHGAADASLAQSDPVLIHVFPPLQLLPKFVSLLPGSRFVLRLEGGPRASSIVYASSDPSVAEVTAAGELTALKLGTVTVTAQAWGMDSMTGERAVLAETFMVLTVALPDGVDIFVPTSRLLVGESLKLVARSRRGQSPFSFAGANVSFAWEVDDAEVLSLQPVHPLSESGRTLGAGGELIEDAFAAWVQARRVGQTLVRINVHVESPLYGSLFLQDTHTFVCVPKLRLLSPAWMLLPPGARARIRTNQDHDRLSYSLLSEAYHAPGVRGVDGVGQVVASDAPGTSIVVVRDERNEQWVSVKVEVKAVSHIALMPTPPYFATVPVGSTTMVRIQLRDDLGRLFHLGPDVSIGIGHSVGVGSERAPAHNGTYEGGPCAAVPASSSLDTGFGALRTFSNDAYVASAEIIHNATVAVSAKREGTAVLKIWLPYVHYAYLNEARGGGNVGSATGSHRHTDGLLSEQDDDMKAVQRWTHDEIIDDESAAADLRHALARQGLLSSAGAPTSAQAGGLESSPGRRLMALSDGRMLADYLALKVVNVLQPESPVTVLVGGTVQFTAFTPEGSSWVSYWEAADPDVVSIDRSTGLARAHRVGRATVYYHSSASGTRGEHETTPTHATVEVVRMESVKLQRRSASMVVSNVLLGTAEHAAPVLFDLSFADERQRALGVQSSGHVDHSVRFECSSPDHAWADAWALGPGASNSRAAPAWLLEAVDEESAPVCALVPKPVASRTGVNTSASGRNDVALPRGAVPQELRVRVSAQSSNGRSKVMASDRVPFVAGFALQPVGSAATLPMDEEGCWVLSRALRSARLNVYGDTQAGFSVTSANEELVKVQTSVLSGRQQHAAEPSLQVDLAVAGSGSRQGGLPGSFRAVDINIVHAVTGQKYDMCISFDDGGGLPDAGVQHAYDGVWLVAFLALVVVVLLAILLRVVFCGAGSSGGVANVPMAPATPRAPVQVQQHSTPGSRRVVRRDTSELVTPSRYRYERGLPPSRNSVVGEADGQQPYFSASGRSLPLRRF